MVVGPVLPVCGGVDLPGAPDVASALVPLLDVDEPVESAGPVELVFWLPGEGTGGWEGVAWASAEPLARAAPSPRVTAPVRSQLTGSV